MVGFMVYNGLAAGRWLSPDSSIFSTNKTDGHDIAQILLKVALKTIKPNQTNLPCFFFL
jgi:hypothetical protein